MKGQGDSWQRTRCLSRGRGWSSRAAPRSPVNAQPCGSRRPGPGTWSLVRSPPIHRSARPPSPTGPEQILSQASSCREADTHMINHCSAFSCTTLTTRSPGPRRTQPQRPVLGRTTPEGSSWTRGEKQGDHPARTARGAGSQSQPLGRGFWGTWPGLGPLKGKTDKNKRAPPCTHSWPRRGGVGRTICQATRYKQRTARGRCAINSSGRIIANNATANDDGRSRT